MQVPGRLKRFADSFSEMGLVVGAVLFSLSLTPSLLPRDALVQGVLSGCVFAVGYGIGVFLQWVWEYMQLKLPEAALYAVVEDRRCGRLHCPDDRLSPPDHRMAELGARRDGYGARSRPANPLWVLLVAVVPAAILIYAGKLLAYGGGLVSRWLARYVPDRVALVVSLDHRRHPDRHPLQRRVAARCTASRRRAFPAARHRRWTVRRAARQPHEIGQRGFAGGLEHDRARRPALRETGPTKADIETLTRRPAMEPLRI